MNEPPRWIDKEYSNIIEGTDEAKPIEGWHRSTGGSDHARNHVPTRRSLRSSDEWSLETVLLIEWIVIGGLLGSIVGIFLARQVGVWPW